MGERHDLQPCGHPTACIVIGEQVGPGQYVHYCGWCADLENGKAEVARLQETLKCYAADANALRGTIARLQEALMELSSGPSDLWDKALEAANRLYETWAKHGTNHGATMTALAEFMEAWDEMLE